MFHRTIHNQEVGLRRSRERLPQWTGREHTTVTKAPGAINHDDLAVPRETQVLQAIVGDNDVNTPLNERTRGRDTIATHYRHATRTAGYEQGLVANILPTRLGAHQARLLPAARSVTS